MSKCIFCFEQIKPTDPPEHAMPQWLKRFLPKDYHFIHQPGMIIRDGVKEHPPLPSFRSKKPSVATNVVCKDCNNGWMSDLETDISQVLPPIIKGEDKYLSLEDKLLIAQWVTKTVIVWQFVQSNQSFIPSTERHYFYKEKTPPSNIVIRAGKYVSDLAPYMGYQQAHRSEIAPPHMCDPSITSTYNTVIKIGNVFFDILWSKNEVPILGVKALVDIWPSVDSDSWPTPLVYNDFTFATSIVGCSIDQLAPPYTQKG